MVHADCPYGQKEKEISVEDFFILENVQPSNIGDAF